MNVDDSRPYRNIIRELIGLLGEHNPQHPDMEKLDECSEGHVHTCGQCEVIHRARRLLWPYSLTLSLWELESLAFCADRGYFPTELYDHLLGEIDDEKDHKAQQVIGIPEHVAWSLTELREEGPDAYLACLGGDLLTRIIELEESIV